MKQLILFLLLFSVLAYGQDTKKIQKLLGENFVQMKASTAYALVPENATFYPSWTNKDDTTGASNGKEFILYEDSLSFYHNEAFKFFRTDYVSNADWQKFTDRVLDSIMRVKLWLNINPTKSDISFKELEKLFNLEKNWKDKIGTDANKYFIYLGKASWNYDFDWKRKFDLKLCSSMYADLYLRPNERFLRRYEIDQRKINYRFQPNPKNIKAENWITTLGLPFEEINVSVDRDVWASSSSHSYDLKYNLSHHYAKSERFKDSPVVGVLATQTKAYFEYLKEIYQKQIDEAGLPYRVHISLPTQEELIKNGIKSSQKIGVQTEEKDVTEQWQITNAEYKEFIDWVQDSIIREQIYLDREGKLDLSLFPQMLNHEKDYYDESEMTWKAFDVSKPYLNRSVFNLNFKFDWQKKIDKAYIDTLLKDFMDGDHINHQKIFYKYQWIDYKNSGVLGELKWVDYQYGGDFECVNSFVPCRSKGLSNGVRRHEDNSLFIMKEEVALYPGFDCRACNKSCLFLFDGEDHFDENENFKECGRCRQEEFNKDISAYDFESNPDALVQGITYYQALAFYNWKYQKANVFEDDKHAIYEDLVPSEEEFKRAQSGEKMIVPTQQIDYPSPVFRYVVHFFEK